MLLYFAEFFSEQHVLSVAGHEIYAHKVIVSARSEVMATMFGGYFVEGTSSVSEVNDYLFIYFYYVFVHKVP